VLGTLAGDNTILLVIRSDGDVPQVLQRLNEMIK